MTTAQWFDRVGMPATAREALWDWLALGIAAEPVERESAKVFADVLATGIRIGARDRVGVTIGYPTVDLDTLYITGAEKVFEKYGVQVRYRTVARKVIITAGLVTGVRLADGTEIPADAVVCARYPIPVSADCSTICPNTPSSTRRPTSSVSHPLSAPTSTSIGRCVRERRWRP